MRDREYCFIRLQDADQRDLANLRAGLEQTTLPALARAGMTPFGLWYGLFGIRSNELILVTNGDGASDALAVVSANKPAGARIIESHRLRPTARPLTDAPCTRSGLYVFRFFDVNNRDVDEIAELSRVAWESFENVDAYAAVPQALFCQRERGAERGVMLLLTWYDNLTSWQTSRQPAPEATANFRRRAAQTFGTVAYATRLVGT